MLWVAQQEHADALDTVTARIRASTEGRSILVASASATSRWLWLSGSGAPDPQELQSLLADVPEVQATVGRPGRGLSGFIGSHRDALAAQAVVIRLESDQQLAAYADVELIDALTKDPGSARRFVTSTLGPLASADRDLRETLLTYVQCGFSSTRAAARLYAHRNTVERRVARANELSSVKVEANPTQVAAALSVLDMAPRILDA